MGIFVHTKSSNQTKVLASLFEEMDIEYEIEDVEYTADFDLSEEEILRIEKSKEQIKLGLVLDNSEVYKRVQNRLWK